MSGQNAVFFTDGWITTLNIYPQVGLVTLNGLVSKKGILIVQFANEMRRGGMDKLRAVREAAMMQLRPVLMTSAATLCGHFPVMLVSGVGAAARNWIDSTVVAGMATGSLFALRIIPSIYLLLGKEHAGESREMVTPDFGLAASAETDIPERVEAGVKQRWVGAPGPGGAKTCAWTTGLDEQKRWF